MSEAATSGIPGLVVRDAGAGDADALSPLVAQLGYPADAPTLRARLEALSAQGRTPLVAVQDGAVIGLVTWHTTPVLHRPAPVGRITGLVVAEASRGQGVGAALVQAAEQRLAAEGCELVEVTSNARRTEAHQFYERLGYERTSVKLVKGLRAEG